MNHLLPIPFFIIAIIVLYVSDKYDLKLFKLLSKIVIALSLVVFIYEYSKYLGYDIIEIVHKQIVNI